MSDIKDEVADLVSHYTSGGWVRVVCPACLANDGKRRDNLSVNLDTGFFQCWRCGTRGGIYSGDTVTNFAQTMRTLARLRDESETPLVKMPLGFFALADPATHGTHEGRAATKFLLRRRVTVEAAHEVGCGVVIGRLKYAHRVIIPVVIGGKPRGFSARLYEQPPARKGRKSLSTSPEPKYVYPKGMSRTALFNRDELLKETTEPALMVEGVLDALPHWPRAVAFMGKPVEAQLWWIAKHAKRPVVLCLDGDAWRASLAAAATLARHRVSAATLRLTPGKDPGDFSARELSVLVRDNAKWF